MDTTIDNQQVTPTQLAWLAGIWDGEGTFQIYQPQKQYFTGRLTLTNTSIVMVNEIVKIINFYGVTGHLWLEEPRSSHHKACYHLTINKIENCRKAITLMLPYLVSKKAHAEVLDRFLASREKYKKQPIQDPKTGKIQGVKTQGYSDEEQNLYEQLKKLNQTGQGGTSETTR